MDPDRVEFKVLGTLEITRGGVTVPITSRRQRQLLAAMLIAADRSTTADELIHAVWDDTLPDSPRTALNTLLSRLRTVLGPDSIQSTPTGYRLTHDPDAVDAACFESLRSQGRETPALEAIDGLTRALALWRGPAYAEFADRQFALGEATRLDELHKTCIEDRAELFLEVGDFESAMVSLEPFVPENPLRERALGLLMTALYRLGRHGEALRRFDDHRTMLVEEMGLSPSPALTELELRILNHDLEAATPSPAEPSPPPWLTADNAFLGREHDSAALVEALSTNRLVTVTGAAGVGKTRLAAENLPSVVSRLGVAATIVELAGIEPDHLDSAIAASLGIGSAAPDPRQATLEYLSIKPTLLILDGCEHLIVALGRFLAAALAQCPPLRVLATSRRRIGLTPEQVLPLDPLPTPAAHSESVPQTAAMRLFVERARTTRPGLTFGAADTPVIAEICRRLDGIPLAIELAATRTAWLGVDVVSDHLMEILSGGENDRNDRSLRTTIEWSFELLDDTDQMLLTALAVFEGEFDLEAAQRVASSIVEAPVALRLGGLVEASLVAASHGSRHVRYRLLAIVRHFAWERAAATGRETDIRRAHARHISSVLSRAAETALGPEDITVPPTVDRLAPDIRRAVSWALDAREVELAGQIAGLLVLAISHWQLRLDLNDVVRRVAQDPSLPATPGASLAQAAGAFVAGGRGDLEEGEVAAGEALEAATTADEEFLALFTLGIVTMYSGHHDRSRRAWEALLDIEGLEPARLADGHSSLALIATYRSDLAEARRHLALAWAATEASGSRAQRCFMLYLEGEMAAAEDPEKAVPLLETAVRESDELGADFRRGLASTVLAAAHTRLGNTSQALDVFVDLLDHWLRLAAWPQLWTTLRLLAELLAANRDVESAALLLVATTRGKEAPTLIDQDAHRYAQLESALSAQIGEQTWNRITALASMLPRARIVHRARVTAQDLQAQLATSGT